MLGEDYTFPRVKTMGTKDVDGGRETSNNFLSEYFSELSKEQVLELYDLYRLDFIFFDYSIERYIEFAI